MSTYFVKGEKLKKLREANDWYMKDVGEKLNLTGAQYGKRERGEMSFTIEEFLLLHDIFEMPLEIFLDYVIGEE